MFVRPFFAGCCLALACVGMALADEQPQPAEESKATTPEAAKPGPLPGHSAHGEAFDEGPRQKAYLMGGTGKVSFPISTKVPAAQAFFNQGVGQLHGFWYLEAERSFRQVAALDPECAMAYWGLAMANTNNDKRAKQFIAEAVKKKGAATPREQLYIDALHAYYQAASKDDKERKRAFIRAMENVIHEFPDDIEAKAFLAYYLWNLGKTIGIPSHQAIDSLLELVFQAEPMHPAHHYRIHLWDDEKAARAVKSAGLNGPSSPIIAHQWHMCGHIFSKLQRYDDAAWYQEASARVDHAHMMRDWVMPYEIHNYAHNNEWCIRDLVFVGRIRDAVDLAKNMIELPRHPKRNQSTNRGSGASYGRVRLYEALSTYEMWEEYLALSKTMYMEEDEEEHQIKKERWLTVAYYALGRLDEGNAQLAGLEKRLTNLKADQEKATTEAEAKVRRDGAGKQPPSDPKAADRAAAAKPGEKPAEKPTAEGDKAKPADAKPADAKPDDKQLADKLKKARDDARRPFDSRLRPLDRAIAHAKGAQLAAQGDHKGALGHYEKAGDLRREHLAFAQLRAGDANKAEQTAKQATESSKNQVYALAAYVDVLRQVNKHKEAKEQFEKLRSLAHEADLAAPIFQRLKPLAAEYGYPEDWRLARSLPADAGARPDLNTLGPLRWSPSPAPDWTLSGAEGKSTGLKDYRGKPVVVIFYLGFGCLHCVEQLNAFAPLAKEYQDAGIQLVAVSTDALGELKRSVDACKMEGGFPFPIVSDAGKEVFKAYRAYDDFENAPLHGTFLIDGDGQVRWMDVGAEPFRDAKFLLREAKRLLSQPKTK